MHTGTDTPTLERKVKLKILLTNVGRPPTRPNVSVNLSVICRV